MGDASTTPNLKLRDVAAGLGVSPQKVTAWRLAGMPAIGSGKSLRFDPAAVSEWLREQGLASAVEAPAVRREPRIVESLGEVAAVLGVHRRTVLNWRTEGMPVKHAGGGGRAGMYDLDEIEAWADRTGRRAATNEQAGRYREELEAEKLRKLRRENDVAEGTLVYRDAVRGLIAERYTAARSLLERLPHQALTALPSNIDGETRERVRNAWRRLVELALRSLAGEQDADEELKRVVD